MTSAYVSQACSSAASGHHFDQRAQTCRSKAQLSGPCVVAYAHQACRHRTDLQLTSLARRASNPLRTSRSSAHSGAVRPHTITAFQSQTPIEQAQQLKVPSSGPKFQPFTPQVCRVQLSPGSNTCMRSLLVHQQASLCDVQTGVRQDLLNYRREARHASMFKHAI